MEDELFNVSNDELAGIYVEVANQIGLDNAYKMFQYFRGQQVTFPLRFYSKQCINDRISDEYDGKNIRDIARKYAYSESRVRQILRQSE